MAETADTHAHTEVPSEGHRDGFPPFQKETFPSQLVWLTLTFVALYVMIAKLALPRIGGIFEKRRGRIDEDLTGAARLKDQSEAALQAYEKSLADARSRAQAIAAETHQKLAAQSDERRKVLENELNVHLLEAEKSIAATKLAAMANVRGIAIESAKAIIERLIGTAPAGGSVEAAVENAIKR